MFSLEAARKRIVLAVVVLFALSIPEVTVTVS
jgi:hypothetical protein